MLCPFFLAFQKWNVPLKRVVFIAISSLIFFPVMSDLLLILSSVFTTSKSFIWVILPCPCLSLTQSYVYLYFQHSLFIIAVLMAFSVNLSSVSFLCLFLLIDTSFHLKLYFSPSLPAWKFLSVYQIFWILCCWVLDFLKISLNTLRLCSVVQLLETVSSF